MKVLEHLGELMFPRGLILCGEGGVGSSTATAWVGLTRAGKGKWGRMELPRLAGSLPQLPCLEYRGSQVEPSWAVLRGKGALFHPPSCCSSQAKLTRLLLPLLLRGPGKEPHLLHRTGPAWLPPSIPTKVGEGDS